MKVSELIQKLSEFNGDLNVVVNVFDPICGEEGWFPIAEKLAIDPKRGVYLSIATEGIQLPLGYHLDRISQEEAEAYGEPAKFDDWGIYSEEAGLVTLAADGQKTVDEAVELATAQIQSQYKEAQPVPA